MDKSHALDLFPMQNNFCEWTIKDNQKQIYKI